MASAEEPPTGPETEKRFPPLNVPPGFKATLFACDPLIEYPSGIAAGPRPGSIFVAIDYMTGLGTEIVKRSEVRLVEDTNSDGYADKATLFAGGFNSIQGLTWHSGTLFVMHAPFLTALRDPGGTGTAAERTDLLSGLGLTPEENPVRLHCANGVAAGHDGWLYLALGDHGCDVQRPEGDRLVFHGGGILRCRPDGRDLHIFARGLRNIYDVALDEDLNVFVRDNENDGGTYKVRVCRSFYGADHGYPYLYDDHPDEALPPFADLGLGSSAGGLAYLEPQFPAEYQGNLFFCEWGRAVMRYPLPKPGSNFGPIQEIEFASGAQRDPYGFKPTDLVVQQDGALFVSDYADGQRPKRGRGRIYRITYVGDGAAPSAKSSSAPPAASAEHWLAQLDSESYARRVEAQEATQAQGADGLKLVTTALNQQQLGVRGRLHAIWILARSGAPSTIDELWKLANSDQDARVRAQAIRAIADLADPILKLHRLEAGAGDPELAARLATLGKSQTGPVLLEIIVALGRLRWTGTAEWLKDNLTAPDPALAHAAMQALRQSENWPAILKLLDAISSDPLRAIALRALAERYEPQVVDGLIERLQNESDSLRRREYAITLTRVYRKPGPWVYWGYKPPPRPPNTVDWERTLAIAAALGGVLTDSDRGVRLAVLQQMQREKIAAPLTSLGRWLEEERDPESVAAILASLRDQPSEPARPHLTAIVRNAVHSQANRQAALALLDQPNDDAAQALLANAQALEDGPVLADAIRRTAIHPKLPSVPLLTSKLGSSEPLVRAAAIEALGELGRAEGRSALLTLLNDSESHVRRAAASAAGKLVMSEAIGPLLKLAADSDSSVRRASFDSLRVLKETRAVPLALAAFDDRQVNLSALACLGELGGPEHAVAVADLARRNPSADVPVAVIRVLTDWRARPQTAAQVQQDLDRAVAGIHGASGTLIRWQVTSSLPAGSSLVEQITVDGPPADLTGWTTQFAAGTEARVILAKDAPKDAAWLAHSTVSLSEPADVEFLASSSGNLEVWLNGKSLHQRDEPRAFRADSDRFSTTLAKGDNRLVVLIRSSASPAEFHLHFRKKSAKLEHERLTRAALARAGNLDRGRALFFNTEKSLCLKCHLVGDQGERTGPELTGIGSRFSRIHIVESLLEPSRTIGPSFGTLSVLLKGGQVLSGLKVADSDTTITLADNQGQKHVLPKADIDDQKPSPISTMPLGLEARYSEAEFIDLIAYLTSLKENPSP